MNVEQMSVADLLREGKQAMALAVGSVGPDTRDRWLAAMDEIDLRLAVGDIEEDDLEAVKTGVRSVRDKNAALQELAKATADRDAAFGQLRANKANLQFVQDEFDKKHPALDRVWGQDLSRGAMLLWAWAKENGHV